MRTLLHLLLAKVPTETDTKFVLNKNEYNQYDQQWSSYSESKVFSRDRYSSSLHLFVLE